MKKRERKSEKVSWICFFYNASPGCWIRSVNTPSLILYEVVSKRIPSVRSPI